MRHLILTLALCPVLMFAGNLRAELAYSATPLVVAIEREPVNTEDSVYRAYVTVGSNKFTFLIPDRFRTGGDPEHGKLQLTTVEGNSIITLNFLDDSSPDSSVPDADTYREALASRYPNGKFAPVFSRPAAGQMASVFDIEWKGAAGLAQKTRALYVPTAAGVLAVTLTSGAKSFPEARANLDEVIGTLTFSVNGKLHVHRLSNRS